MRNVWNYRRLRAIFRQSDGFMGHPEGFDGWADVRWCIKLDELGGDGWELVSEESSTVAIQTRARPGSNSLGR